MAKKQFCTLLPFIFVSSWFQHVVAQEVQKTLPITKGSKVVGGGISVSFSNNARLTRVSKVIMTAIHTHSGLTPENL